MIREIRTPAEIQRIVRGQKRSGKSIGLVPTMGALHAGHASLVAMAREKTDFVVASIFVNPAQFGPGEDLDRYPRTLEADLRLLGKLRCDVAFVPAAGDIYSERDRTGISMKKLGDSLCGASRPGHFEGVLLVVSKLFNMVGPDYAFFGQKDAQQAVIIQRMAADLDFPVRIVLGATVREPDGLAISSRNRYLTPDERLRAAWMYRGLREAMEAVRKGERNTGPLKDMMRGSMEKGRFEIEYAEVVDGEDLEPMGTVGGIVLLAAAGRIGKTRLIDNVAAEVAGSSVKEVTLEFPGWSRYA